VDKPEIMAALKVLGIKATQQEIETMISHVDKDNTGFSRSKYLIGYCVTPLIGELDFEQFVELMTNNPRYCIKPVPLASSINELHSESGDREGGLSLATFPLLAKYYSWHS